ncbi:MAG: carboxypeptidase regulatory-like domain-containing protein, partial [Acidobacteriota bacterium]
MSASTIRFYAKALDPRRAVRYLAAGLLLTATVMSPAAAFGNDRCEDATPVVFGQLVQDTLEAATPGGASSCDGFAGGPDRWYRWVAPRSEKSFVLSSTQDNAEISVHAGCPGTAANEIACGIRSLGIVDIAGLRFEPEEGETYFIRVGQKTPEATDLDYSFALNPSGALVGTVTDTAGTPLPGIEVAVGDPDFVGAVTGADGRYRIGGFEFGNVQVFAGRNSDYVAEIYSDIPCPQLLCLAGSGSSPQVAIGFETTVNFGLEPAASISGVLTDEESGATLSGRRVTLDLDSDQIELRLHATTDGLGQYTFDGLVAGDYAILAQATGYVPEYWEDVECAPGTCTLADATRIPVAVGESVEGIDFALNPGLSIRGQVRDAASGAPLAFEAVELRNADGDSLQSVIADGDGRYALTQVAPGTYFVSTASSTYLNEVWPGAPCTFGTNCPTAGATPIRVEADQPAVGIDFALDLGGVVRATVLNRFRGDPVPDSRVRLYSDGGELLSLTLAGEPGVAEVTGVPAGEFRAVAFSPTGAFIAQVYAARDCPSPAP